MHPEIVQGTAEGHDESTAPCGAAELSTEPSRRTRHEKGIATMAQLQALCHQ